MATLSGPQWSFMVENTKTYDEWIHTLQILQEDQKINFGRLTVIHMFTTDVIEHLKRQTVIDIEESRKIEKYYREKILAITQG